MAYFVGYCFRSNPKAEPYDIPKRFAGRDARGSLYLAHEFSVSRCLLHYIEFDPVRNADGTVCPSNALRLIIGLRGSSPKPKALTAASSRIPCMAPDSARVGIEPSVFFRSAMG
jgi:hypothetical protein